MILVSDLIAFIVLIVFFKKFYNNNIKIKRHSLPSETSLTRRCSNAKERSVGGSGETN